MIEGGGQGIRWGGVGRGYTYKSDAEWSKFR
jgi:hypothetical protein